MPPGEGTLKVRSEGSVRNRAMPFPWGDASTRAARRERLRQRVLPRTSTRIVTSWSSPAFTGTVVLHVPHPGSVASMR